VANKDASHEKLKPSKNPMIPHSIIFQFFSFEKMSLLAKEDFCL